jgi:diguanylate cyclase (GGDEF)-like protein
MGSMDATLLGLLVLVVAANVVVLGVVLGRPILRRLTRAVGSRTAASDEDRREAAAFGVGSDPDADRGSRGDRGYERAIRVVVWGFLMAAAGIVAASGLWTAALPSVVVLIAVTGALVLLVGEVLPSLASWDTARRWGWRLGLVVALGFATALVAVTGGAESPFFVAFPIVAIGTALAGGARRTIAVTLGAAAGYGIALAAGGPVTELHRVGAVVNLLALVLLAFVGAVVRAETRRIRETALRLSSIDALTGLYNRSYFFAALEREIARSDRSGRGFCLVMLDVDDLKATNDAAGHHAGDGLLRAVADTVRRGVRKVDVAARYAGDEFVALLPETEPSGGWIWAEKIRLGVSEQRVPGWNQAPTVSIGVVSYPEDGRTADGLMISADKAMYISKRGGKNRVAWASSEPRIVPRETPREAPREVPVVRDPAIGRDAAPGRDRGPAAESIVPRWPEPTDWPGRPVGPGNPGTPGPGSAPGPARPAADPADDDWRWGTKGPGERAV